MKESIEASLDWRKIGAAIKQFMNTCPPLEKFLFGMKLHYRMC